MPVTVELTTLIGMIIAGIIAFTHLRTKFVDHIVIYDKFEKKVEDKMAEDTKNYSACRLGFTTQINGLSGKIDLSEVHHQENKALLLEMKGSIVDLHVRLNNFLQGDFIEIIKGAVGAKGIKGAKGIIGVRGLKGPTGAQGHRGLRGLKGSPSS
jgi:hypothetical protein